MTAHLLGNFEHRGLSGTVQCVDIVADTHKASDEGYITSQCSNVEDTPTSMLWFASLPIRRWIWDMYAKVKLNKK